MFTFKTSTEAKKKKKKICLAFVTRLEQVEVSLLVVILWKQKDKAYLYKALVITTSFQEDENTSEK